MAIVCLDTDLIVDMIRGHAPLSELLALSSMGVSTTMINILELYYGAYKSGKASDLALIDALSGSITVMDLSVEDVKLAGMMMASLDSKGQKLDFRDVVIGAICINRDLAVLTKNIKHFGRMKRFGLKAKSPNG
ncbi:MAG TPA: type II toxin-antitoxin system VapC family toxin [Candidatus Acidoferrales bacterium]|nr:type II toxin-antitoxin system VapC family toxin [Candidatus Acidoferrales bacterium]